MERPSFTFTAPFNVEVMEVKGQQKVFLEGIISSTHLDLVNDIVTKNCLESMQKQILSKNLKLDLEHEAFRGDSTEEKELNKTKVPVGKMFDASVQATEKDHFALFVKSELNPFNDNFEKLKGNVQEGFLDAYSIAFMPTRTIMKNIDGKDVRLLDDVVLLNVALTGNPVNTQAVNHEIFTKSIESLEDYKKEKKSNPDIGEKLEVKGKDKKKKKKKEDYKDYVDDGKHVHTDSSPMGEHNHPEIEMNLDRRVDFLHERIDNILDGSQESELMITKDEKIKEIHNHISDNLIKLQEVKQMSQEDKEAKETNEESEEESKEEAAEAEEKEESKDEESKEESKEEAESGEKEESENAETKALTEKVNAMEKEIAELKSSLKKPVRKSVVEQRDESKDFEVEKAKNPLDLIG